MELIGCDATYLAQGSSYFTVETHLQHLAEARQGERVRVTNQLLDCSGKKLHLFSRMFDSSGQLLATAEQLLIHVSLQTRRSSQPGEALLNRLREIQARHAALQRPERLHCGQR
jgi:carnitine 3-dehydrogenase